MTGLEPGMSGRAKWPLVLLILLNAMPCQADPSKPGGPAHATRQELVGAWRLQRIELVGPDGATSDPFYGQGSTGILIYDPSGWMSVQIVGQHRSAVDMPVSRPWPSDTAKDARRKAAVLDAYYAYFATWEFDEATSTVTHHVVSSLFPSETGASYSQRVALEGEYLIFTTQRELAGSTVVQRKIWQRIKR
jgi:Lipocalin-like domain